MARVAVPYFSLVFLINFIVESAVAQTVQVKNSWNVIEELQILSKAVAGLQEKIEEQANLLTSLQAQSSVQTTLLTKLNANEEMQTTSLSNMEVELSLQKDFLNNLTRTAATQANVLKNIDTKVVMQSTLLTDVHAQSNAQTTLLTDLNLNKEILTTSLRNLEADTESQKNLLNNLEITAARQAKLDSLDTKVDVQENFLANLQAESSVQTILLNTVVAHLEIQATSVNRLVAEQEWQQPVPQHKISRTIVALKGDDVQMWCVVRGTPLPEITWSRENGTLESDRLVIANNRKTLRINNVQFSDQGTYVCVAVNGVGAPVSQSASLEVYGQAQHCHRMIESDTGSLEIEPSSASCLWIIKLKNTTGIRLQLDPQMMEPIQIIPEQSPSNYNLSSFRIKGSNNDSHEFKGKSLAIVVPSRREKTTLHWRGLVLDDFGVSSSTEFKNDLEGTLEWEPKREGTYKIFWAFELAVAEPFSWTLNTTDLAIDLEHPCETISLAVLEISQDGNVSEIEKTCEGSSSGYLMSNSSSQVFILLHLKSVKKARSHLKVTWGHIPLKKNIQGILCGTQNNGAFVIPFNSTQTRTISSRSGFNFGLAFDWDSRRIYTSQNGVGIMRSNLDGSDSKTLLLDPSSKLEGMAIDPITGNFYYGNSTSRTIRVCNNDATKCSLIANSSDLSYVRDFAIHSSKGLVFWSVLDSKVVRANLDGSNAQVIVEGLNVLGIDVDEHEDRLYWGDRKEGIRSCDLNGRDIQMIYLSASVQDVAIDGDKIYYSNYDNNGIHITLKSRINSSLVTKLMGYAYPMTLYGMTASNRPLSPCTKSQCAHLCVVMSPPSFRCMCPENQKLNEDGRTCEL